MLCKKKNILTARNIKKQNRLTTNAIFKVAKQIPFTTLLNLKKILLLQGELIKATTEKVNTSTIINFKK